MHPDPHTYALTAIDMAIGAAAQADGDDERSPQPSILALLAGQLEGDLDEIDLDELDELDLDDGEAEMEGQQPCR